MIELDEHEVPNGLGERVPLIPFPFPFDWTMRQVYWFVMCIWMGGTLIDNSTGPAAIASIWGYVAIGVLGVAVEYMVKPTPEFWFRAVTEYLAVLTVSFPLWWKRLIPLRKNDRPGIGWPLAVLPHWLGARVVQHVHLRDDGVLELPGRKTKYAAVINLEPRPHPDLMPLLLRQSLIAQRLSIFKRIRGIWSLHLQVRPFDATDLEVASGPAWGWVAHAQAPRMVERRPALVLYGDQPHSLLSQAEAILTRFRQVNMRAALQTGAEARRMASELYSDMGLTTGRVRVGINRVVTGLRTYQTYALIEMPRVIHLAWLRPLTSESLMCDVAIHVNVRRPGPTRRDLERKTRAWRAHNDEEYELAVSDAVRTVGTMRRNEDTAAEIGVYVTTRAEQAQEVVEALETSQCEFRSAKFMQHRALRATRTLGGDPYHRTMKADLRTVATTDLLATAGYWPDGCTLIGEALSAPEPIGINLLDDSPTGNINWSMFIAAMMGAGKTTTAELLAWRMANPHPSHPLHGTGVQIVSVDFKATGDLKQLYHHLSERGQKASYNPWTSGKLPPIDGHTGFNMADVPDEDRGERLLELGQRLEEWAARHALFRPLLLLIDEVLGLIEAPSGAAFMRRFGTQSRSSNTAVIFMSQSINLVLKNQLAGVAFENCGHVYVGRHSPAGINAMAPLLNLEPEAQVLLASAPAGAGLLRIERRDGARMVGVQITPTEWEKKEFGTNPSERRARYDASRGNGHVLRSDLAHSVDHPDQTDQGVLLGSDPGSVAGQILLNGHA